jgi:hypothetical protein
MSELWKIDDIKKLVPTASVISTSPVIFDEKWLGKHHWQLFRELFPSMPGQLGFKLCRCSMTHGNPLTITGTFAELFPRKEVDATVCLFDDETGNRQAVVLLPGAHGENALTYLSKYSLDDQDIIDGEDHFAAAEIAPTTSLGAYIEKITTKTDMIFSTFDYGKQSGADRPYPETFRTVPPDRVKRGLNFGAEIGLNSHDEDLDQFLQSALALSKLTVAGSRHWCLIHAHDGGSPFFTFARAIQDATLTVGPVSFSLTGISIVLALARPLGGRIGPQIRLDGMVTVSSTPFPVTVAFDYPYSELSLSFTGFPSLGELLTHLGLNATALPVPLSQMLDIGLSKLAIVLDLDNKSVSEISFELTGKNIDLIESVLALEPKVVMQVYHPLDAKLRSFEGRLCGKWKFEGIDFTTRVAYPSLDFYAGMDKGQSVSTKQLVQRLLPGIDLPVLTFTTMEIEGNVREKSFSAVIEAEIHNEHKDDKTWGFSASKLNGIRLALTYANQQMSDCRSGRFAIRRPHHDTD